MADYAVFLPIDKAQGAGQAVVQDYVYTAQYPYQLKSSVLLN